MAVADEAIRVSGVDFGGGGVADMCARLRDAAGEAGRWRARES